MRTDTQQLVLKLNKQIECDRQLIAGAKGAIEVILTFNAKCFNIKLSKAIKAILPSDLHISNSLTDWEYVDSIRYSGLKLRTQNRCILDNSCSINIDCDSICLPFFFSDNNRINSLKTVELINITISTCENRIKEVQAALIDMDEERESAKQIRKLIEGYNAKHSSYIRSVQIEVRTLRY